MTILFCRTGQACMCRTDTVSIPQMPCCGAIGQCLCKDISLGAYSMSCFIPMHVCLLLLCSFKTPFSGFAQPEAIRLAMSRALHIFRAQCQDALTIMVLSAAKFSVEFGFALLLNWLIHHVTLTSLLHVGSSAVSHLPPPCPHTPPAPTPFHKGS